MPRYLRALRLDREHMDGPDTGLVVRVFDRAAHLSSMDGSLIFLTAKDLPDGPRGIRLETPGGFSFKNGLRAGDPYAIRGDWLRLGRDGLKIDLSTAAGWRPGGITAPARAPAAARVPEIVSGAERQDLCRATRDGNAIDAAFVLGPHIGRGPGLTPAGDDFTVGYLAGLHAHREAAGRRRNFIDSISAWLTTQLARTNDVAAAYLGAAARGIFADTVRNYAVRPDERNLRRLLGFGDSSGAAVVDGYRLAAQSWGRQQGANQGTS